MAPQEQGSGTTDVLDLLSKLIHREILRLALLVGIAIAAFFVTRAIAASNHETTLRDGAQWYSRGQRELAAGNVKGAVDAFRRARLRNRNEKRYTLAYAQALAANGDATTAHNALLSLRQSQPEDPTINLALARVAAAQRSIGEAVRYYQNALYAPWPAGQEGRRRAVRLELIRLLLRENQRSRAIPELIALSSETPDSLAARLLLAQMLSHAGDPERALEQFGLVLRRDPANTSALAGAGRASFELGDYSRAARYLRRVPRDSSALQQLAKVVSWILRSDPLAPRIERSERWRRLQDSFTYAKSRLLACAAASPASAQPEILPLSSAAGAFDTALRTSTSVVDSTLTRGLQLIYDLEQAVSTRCGNDTPRDRALILIAERHMKEGM